MVFRKENSQSVVDENVVTYDTDKVSILGEFDNEMAAYRTRKEWVQILANYFLVERDRDYSLNIEALKNDKKNQTRFKLECSFSSACGKYAFWRLINNQAPEAEKLIGIKQQRKENLENLFHSIWHKENILDLDDSWILDELDKDKSWCPNFLSSAFKKINKLL